LLTAAWGATLAASAPAWRNVVATAPQLGKMADELRKLLPDEAQPKS
jgi:hypothetical protein